MTVPVGRAESQVPWTPWKWSHTHPLHHPSATTMELVEHLVNPTGLTAEQWGLGRPGAGPLSLQWKLKCPGTFVAALLGSLHGLCRPPPVE